MKLVGQKLHFDHHLSKLIAHNLFYGDNYKFNHKSHIFNHILLMDCYEKGEKEKRK